MRRRELLLGAAAAALSRPASAGLKGSRRVLLAAPHATAALTLGQVAAAIRSDGWSANLTFGKFKTGGALTLAPDSTPTVTFTVKSAGFDSGGNATTITRTIIGTVAVRQPFPTETARQESIVGGDDVLAVALSDFVYAGDTVTLTAAFGVVVDNGSGGGGTSSAPATAVAVANQSTATAPKPIAAWAIPQMQRVTADFIVELAVAHRHGQAGKMVNAVTFTATGQTSGAQYSATVSAMTASAQASRTGLKVPVFSGTIVLAGFTQNEVVLVDAIVCPFVGPKLQASVDGAAWPTPNFAQLRFICDKGGTYSGATAWVDPVGGNDTTGTVNNSANKYLSLGKALTAIQAFHNANRGRNNIDGGTVLVEAGTLASFGPTDPSTLTFAGQAWCTVKADTGHSKSDITYNMSDTTNVFIPQGGVGGGINWQNLKFSSTASNTFGFRGNNTSQQTWFDNCDLIGDGTTVAPFYQNGYLAYTNSLIQHMGGAVTLAPFGNNVQAAYLVAGCDCDNLGGCIWYTALGNLYHNGGTFSEVVTSALSLMPVPNQVMIVGTKTVGLSGNTVHPWYQCGFQATAGVAFVQNIVEITTASEVGAAVQISADADVDPCPHAVVAYNTIVGARMNYLYNELGSTAIAKAGVSCANILANFNIKRDTFVAVSGNANRIGNWSFSHHVGGFGDTNQTGSFSGSAPSGDSWEGEYLGLGSLAVNNVGTSNPYKFTTDAASVAYGGSGAGNGNYLPSVNTSKAKGLVPAGRAMLPIDIAGTARPNDGTGYAGAFEGPQ